MDIKTYFSEVREKIEKLSDEEFDQLLLESGLEKCPYEEDFTWVAFWQASDSFLTKQNLKSEFILPFEQTIALNSVSFQNFWSYSIQNNQSICFSKCNDMQFVA